MPICAGWVIAPTTWSLCSISSAGSSWSCSRAASSGHSWRSRSSRPRSSSAGTYFSRHWATAASATSPGSSAARTRASVCSQVGQAATAASTSSVLRSRRSATSYRAHSEIVPSPTFIPCESGGSQSRPSPSISHRWENWWPAPEAGREDWCACIATPDISKPSASRPIAPGLPAASCSGSAIESRNGSCTRCQTCSAIGSTPRASASIQSAPAGIFSIRSPTPVAVSRPGASARIRISATIAAGAGQYRVILNPSLVIEAP